MPTAAAAVDDERFVPMAAGALVRAPGTDLEARRQLREQIARLERTRSEIGLGLPAQVASALARPVAQPDGSASGARLSDLGELERERDRLVADVARLRGRVTELDRDHAVARRTLDRALADPGSARWLRISNRDLGLPGCTTYSVRPRLSLLGLLLDWWVVKVSSGCPRPARPAAASARDGG